VVDVLNREGKKQHRFDVVSYTQGTPVALAAAGGAEKQRWLAVMETKQAKRAREWRVLAATIPGWGAGAVTLCNIGVSSSSSRCRYSSCVYYRRYW
jgi:hypothetical protein